MPRKVLIVEDELDFQQMLKRTLEKNTKQYFYEVEWATTGQEGIDKAKEFFPELILLDMNLPKKNGFQVIEELANEDYIKRIVPITGRFQEKHLQKLTSQPKIQEYIIKGKQNNKHYVEVIFRNELSDNSFHYEELDPKLAEFISEKAQAIQIIFHRQLKDVVKTGNLLSEVKARLEYGQFLRWLRTELDCSHSLARKFIRTAETFNQIDIENLDISPSAAYAIAQSNIPAPVKEELIGRARQGEKILPKLVKQVRDRYEQQGNPKVIEAASDDTLEVTSEVPSEKPATVTNTQHSGEILKVTKSNRWLELGSHRIYCGSPDSKEFQKALPDPIILLLYFPPSFTTELPAFPQKIQQYITIYTEYKDEVSSSDWGEILNPTLTASMERFTQEQETIVFCYLPDPTLLIHSHLINCHTITAEPRKEQCDQLVELWEQRKDTRTLT
ncbi:MAG: response regulator [Cyanobacteria bacterium]|jgi:CheY-like chemotaxis protein|nr:response regulator [Cyanobacteria bacterium GSL.Bin1]